MKTNKNSFQNELKSNQFIEIIYEEKRSFFPGWIENSNERFSSSIFQSFQYKLNENGYIYDFHGSLLNLRNNL